MFWALLLGAAGLGAAYLQYLGPPAPVAGTVQAAVHAPESVAAAPAPAQPKLPVLPPGSPEIAVMLAGLGYDPAQSLQAATALPASVSFAVSPFGGYLNETEAYARANGHELILMLPMQALLARAPAGQNQALFNWSLGRLPHVTGVTDAIGPAMGGGFMQDADARNWLLGNIASHGLYYIEGDMNAAGFGIISHRVADAVIDPVNDSKDEAGQLARLIAIAKSKHSALAVILGAPPDSLTALANWTATLGGMGIALVPASALVNPPLPMSTSSLP